jgi:ribosomal protein S12 methylthiotransferase
MLGLARARGHDVVASPEEADVVVVNTCSFLGQAREESIDTILGLARFKADGGASRLLVTGCMVEEYAEELLDEIPEIDACVGTTALESFADALEPNGTRIFKGDKHYLPAANVTRSLLNHDGSAYLKVSEGCDHDCAFCIIPRIRGPHRSRRVSDLLEEAQGLVARGVVELNLVAQDLSAYGHDVAECGGLPELLARMGRIDGLERVRCLYLYPNAVSDELLDTMAAVDNVCPYVDMPLQHADAGILRLMRRGGGPDSMRRIIDRIRARLDNPVLRTTFIVGFPGETEEAFRRLCDFVEEVHFDRIGLFVYSPEPGSHAADLPGAVAPELAWQRHDELVSIQEAISAERQASYVGTTARVLICGTDDDGLWYGRTDGQAPEIDGVTYLGAEAAVAQGQLVKARITGADVHDLYGEVYRQ